MIEHLRGRDRKLEPLGWTGAAAEWIALVCLHSGVFMRGQFCDYFGASRQQAQRFVKALVDRREAVENPHISFSGGTKPCRISSNAIYQALGVKKIRKRPSATKTVLMRQLLSLDFVLKHSSINWLPAEPEKVEFFEKLGVPLRLLPRRIYCGVVGAHKRYFTLKMPLAVEPDNHHLCLRRSGPPDAYRTPRVGSRAWAALGCASQEGAAGSRGRNCR